MKIRNLIHTLSFRCVLVLFILMLPLVLAVHMLYLLGNRAITNELNASASSNVSYLRDSLEDAVNTVNVQLEYTLTTDKIRELDLLHDTLAPSDYYLLIREISDLLSLSVSNRFVERVELSFLSHGICVSNTGFRTLSRDELNATVRAFNLQSNSFTSSDSAFYVDCFRPFHLDRNILPQYHIRAVLKTSQLQKMLSSFSHYSNKNAFLIHHPTGQILASSELESTDLWAVSGNFTQTGSSDVYIVTDLLISSEKYEAVACYSKALNTSFVQLVPMENLRSIPRFFFRFFLFFSGLCFAILLLLTGMINRFIRRPISDLNRAFSSAGKGDLSVRLAPSYALEFNDLAGWFNTMTAQLKHLIESQYESTIRAQSSELKYLQSQINPHFLYNSFFCLRQMLQAQDLEHARELTGYLGKYFQYITRNSGQTVTLLEEYEHALQYVHIQLIRFEDFIHADIQSLPTEYENLPIPRIILQPVFENAIEHGIQTTSGEGFLRLSFSRSPDGLLQIIVEDNGNRLTSERISDLQKRMQADTSFTETSGLINIHKRLRLYFQDDRCGLALSHSDLGGLRVIITLLSDFKAPRSTRKDPARKEPL